MGGRGTSSPVAKYTVRAGSGTLPPGQGREDEEKEPVTAAAEGETIAAASSVDSSAASVDTAERPQNEQVGASAVSDQASAAPATPAQDESELPYVTLINQETALGGAIYPFLEQTGRAWAVVSHDLEDPTSYPRSGTFGMSKPTLRYVKDGKIEDVFVDGMPTEQFLAKKGLQLGMDKGGFVLSKRLSRVMRPYFASGSFDSRTVNMRYLEQDETQKKVWDGAGLISRAMVERLMIPDGTPPAKRAELLREIAQCKRIEFTVMTERGQDKGHAIVSDDLDADFVLPMDTKKEVKLVNGQTWVGVNFVHAHDDMRIDIQSLINLHPFFSEEQYAQWLEDEGNLFAHAVESGQVDAAMQRIDPFATMEDVEAWHLREYFTSGGHAMWSASVTRNLMNQHFKRLNETTLEKMRLPIPGGRYYVLPVGERLTGTKERYRHAEGILCTCQTRSLPMETIHAEVRDVLVTLRFRAETLGVMRELARQMDVVRVVQQEDREAHRRVMLKRYRRRLLKVQGDYEDGELERAQYEARIQNLEAKIAVLETHSLGTLDTPISLLLCIDPLSDLRQLWQIALDAERQILARLLFEDIVYDLDARRITAYHLKPWLIPLLDAVNAI